MIDTKIVAAIHGDWGAGKTYLAHTLPGPRLVFDLEGQTGLVALGEMRYWDPVVGKQSLRDVVAEDEWHDDLTVVVQIPVSALHIYRLLEWLEITEHKFESVILDSFTEGEDRLKEMVSSGDTDKNGNPLFDQQAWGRLKDQGIHIIRRFRNLSWESAKKPVNVAIVMGSNMEVMPHVPLLQGGIRGRLVSFFNLVGFIHNGELDGKHTRVLQLRATSVAAAKCNIHAVNTAWPEGKIYNPDFKDILAVINNKENA